MDSAPGGPVHLYFFRSLSTHGHDNAKWSILDFGPVYKHFARAFSARGVIFHPVTGLGSGTLGEMTARALDFFRRDEVWNSAAQAHWLGHSAGGLIARLTLEAMLDERGRQAFGKPLPTGKILSLLTVASPNRGSKLAQLCIDLPVAHPRLAHALKSCGYDVQLKKPFFKELTATNIGKVFSPRNYFPPSKEPVYFEGVRLGSIVCSSPRSDWCLPLRLFYLLKALKAFDLESDGLVEKETQGFAEVLADLEIDHFRQFGLFGKRWKFENMCDTAADFFKETQARLKPNPALR